MRKHFYQSLSFSLLFSILIAGASAQITTPRTPSPAAMVQQTVGISTVTVNYSRPSVKGREIWGQLVPYGWNIQGFGTGNSAPWRAGANENSVIEFSDDATVQGKKVPAGKYGLFFTISADNKGQIILSKDHDSWGSFFYDSSQDVLRAPIDIRTVAATEMLTFNFLNNTKNSTELVLDFEKKEFPVKIEFDVDKIVMENAKKELKGSTGFTWLGFASAANYALQNKTNLEQALAWSDQAVAQNNSFATLSLKSNILNQLGRNDEAEKIIKNAIGQATEIELNNYGYQLLNNGMQDKAIEIFKVNTQQHPKSANAWDSLGEGYFLKGDKKNAAINFKKALIMNPAPNVKANSEKYLKQMGQM